MKHTLCFITILLGSLLDLYANNENDSLLKVLDKVISERLVYTEKKEATIKELKAKKKEQKTLDDMYRLNSEIISQYSTFVCDSAEQYINENIEIAQKMGNNTYLLEGRLQLAFVYSLSGLFVQATDIFKSIKCDTLPDYLKALYCWNHIRYYENLIKYTDDARFSREYMVQKEAYRDTLMTILYDQSDEYFKENKDSIRKDLFGVLNGKDTLKLNIVDTITQHLFFESANNAAFFRSLTKEPWDKLYDLLRDSTFYFCAEKGTHVRHSVPYSDYYWLFSIHDNCSYKYVDEVYRRGIKQSLKDLYGSYEEWDAN